MKILGTKFGGFFVLLISVVKLSSKKCSEHRVRANPYQQTRENLKNFSFQCWSVFVLSSLVLHLWQKLEDSRVYGLKEIDDATNQV